MRKLNLGCSDDHKPGYINIDQCQPADIVIDLSKPWKELEDSSADEIYAHDVAEHLPKIHFMNEAWRVLKPGGLLDLAVPCVMLADGRVNPGAFADPTHVAYWTIDDKYYYCKEWNTPFDERGRLGPSYGITALFDMPEPKEANWKLTEYGPQGNRRSKIFAKLIAVK